MRHTTVAVYFYHLAVSVFVTGLTGAFLFAVISEGLSEAIPFVFTQLIIASAWAAWRIRIQLRYKFMMTRAAFRTYYPALLVTMGILSLSLIELASLNASFRSEFKFLVLTVAGVGALAASVHLLNYDGLARREKIVYRKRRSADDTVEGSSRRRRSSRSRPPADTEPAKVS